ncbi:putative DNA-binding transcriptional regulator YafY [Anaerotaenia torta]|uniref:helix-turn-helix transcriptional regulator n=1 Tax=Anaerotaenia torta TaxID=433293 RepID=UPI003D232525
MKIDRLLAITMYLLNRGTVSASALAERFEVSKRTIQRDIDALNQAGIPIISTYGKEGGYEIMDGFKLTKQIADVEDYLNIIVALKGLSSAIDSRKINETLEKALTAMQGDQQRVFINLSAARERTFVNESLKIIDKAIDNRTPLRIDYTNAAGDISERIVEPLALSYQWYSWYLFAYCTAKQDYRLFKLSRVSNCQAAAGSFSKQHGNTEALMKIASAPDKRTYLSIRLLCKKEIRQQVMEYLTDHVVEERENGDFIAAMSVPLERMWFSLLMGFGSQIQVLEPEILKSMLRERAEEILSVT